MFLTHVLLGENVSYCLTASKLELVNVILVMYDLNVPKCECFTRIMLFLFYLY